MILFAHSARAKLKRRNTMAKLKAPLMSFGAAGKLGDSLTFSKWKGISTVRQKVDPANPKTAAQTAQRDRVTNSVAFWRSNDLDAGIHPAWNRSAQRAGRPMSGFNNFSSNAVRAQAEDDDASFATNLSTDMDVTIQAYMANIDDLATGDETGDFTMVVGSSPGSMSYSYTAAISSGTVTFDLSADFSGGDEIYCQIRKSCGGTCNYDRCGVHNLTLSM